MKKALLIATALLSFSLPCFADTYVRLNRSGTPTGYLYTIDTGTKGNFMEFQVVNGNPKTNEQSNESWKKYPHITCAGMAEDDDVYLNRVLLANDVKNSNGEYVEKHLPYAVITYKFSRLDNGNMKVYPVYAENRYWKAAVDLSGVYVMRSAMTYPSENMLLSYLPLIHKSLTKGMFDDLENKIETKCLSEDKDRKKYPGIDESLDEAYSVKVTDRTTKRKIEFVGNRCLEWIYRIEPDGTAFPIHNKNGLG